MDTEVLREAILDRPFKPFSLKLADGRELPVRHPEFVAVAKRRVVYINHENEAISILEPLLILSLEFRGADAPTSTSTRQSS